jgi:integrase
MRLFTGSVQIKNISQGGCESCSSDPVRRLAWRPLDFSGHSLRAGCATQSAVNGASEAPIMRMTGHKSVNMVRRYIHDGELVA